MKLKLIIFLLFLMTEAVFSQNSTPNPKIIKVLSFNILHGATTKGDFDLDKIAQVILDADPDFVAMQEVDYKTNRGKNYDLATELGWRTKMAPVFGKAMDFDGGAYGEGILSKFSFFKTRNITLPYSSGREPRSALEIVTVLKSGDTIALIGTHLDHFRDETDRIAQAKKINEVFSSNTYPSILAGDMNAVPKSKTIDILEELWTGSYDKLNPAPTAPSSNPSRKIDYIMVTPKNRWKVLETRVIQDPIASDHCAYLVTLELLD